MEKLNLKISLIFALDLALMFLGLYHLPQVINRADVPFHYYTRNSFVYVSGIKSQEKSGGLKPGDAILKWNGQKFSGSGTLEFLTDLALPDENIKIEYSRGEITGITSIQLVEFYPSKRFTVVQVFVSLLVWLCAVYLLLKSRYNYAASYLHWMFVSFSIANLIAWGSIKYHPDMEIVTRGVFLVAYVLVSVFFLLFTFQYPRQATPSVKKKLWLVILPNLLLIAPMIYYHLSAIELKSVELFGTFQFLFDLFRSLMVIYFVIGIIRIIHSYHRASLREERERLQWIFWGSCIGALPFLLFYILPQLVLSRYIISEEITMIFFLAVPLSFVIALFRYKIYDIELLVNRSIVYSFVIIVLLGGYVMVVLLTASEIKGEEEFFRDFNAVFITLVIAFSFNFVRRKIQDVIDKKLFSATVNYKKAVTQLSETLSKAGNEKSLIDESRDFITAHLPVSKIESYLLRDKKLSLFGYYNKEAIPPKTANDRYTIIGNSSSGTGVNINAYIPPDDIRTPEFDFSDEKFFGDKAVCVHSGYVKIKPENQSGPADSWFEQNDAHCAIALTAQDKSLLGLILLKLPANESMNEDELGLLSTLQLELSSALEKFRIFESYILAREENTRLDELNKLKSYFVSSVSHDLKTPITSIKMFAELLQMNPDTPQEKAADYLRTIEEESARLTRLINNLLDFAKIEKGTKDYSFSKVNLNSLVGEVMRIMDYQLKSSRFEAKIKVPDQEFIIKGDKDSIIEAVINLISNSIKFSVEKREISIGLIQRDHYAILTVADKGLGIKPENIKNIFEPFYREKTKEKSAVGGAGLGLSIVQHIMDAHGGKIDVISNEGQGTMFMLLFPLDGQDEINSAD